MNLAIRWRLEVYILGGETRGVQREGHIIDDDVGGQRPQRYMSYAIRGRLEGHILGGVTRGVS